MYTRYLYIYIYIGGHFAAREQPELLAGDLRDYVSASKLKFWKEKNRGEGGGEINNSFAKKVFWLEKKTKKKKNGGQTTKIQKRLSYNLRTKNSKQNSVSLLRIVSPYGHSQIFFFLLTSLFIWSILFPHAHVRFYPLLYCSPLSAVPSFDTPVISRFSLAGCFIDQIVSQPLDYHCLALLDPSNVILVSLPRLRCLVWHSKTLTAFLLGPSTCISID